MEILGLLRIAALIIYPQSGCISSTNLYLVSGWKPFQLFNWGAVD